MNIISICGLCIVSTAIILLLKKHNPEISMIISVATGILIAFSVIELISDILLRVKGLVDNTSINSENIEILFKSLGICFLCQFASDSCNDAGEKALASKIELAGKIAVVIIVFPLIEKITYTALELINYK